MKKFLLIIPMMFSISAQAAITSIVCYDEDGASKYIYVQSNSNSANILFEGMRIKTNKQTVMPILNGKLSQMNKVVIKDDRHSILFFKKNVNGQTLINAEFSDSFQTALLSNCFILEQILD